MNLATVADRWGYSPSGSDKGSQPEHLIRDEVAALYARWRHEWNHSLVRKFHIGVDHVDASEIVLQLEVRHFDVSGSIFEEILRDVVKTLGKRAVRSYVLLFDPTRSYMGTCLTQAGVKDVESVFWSNEPFQFANRLTFGRSAPKVPLRSIAEEMAAVMRQKQSRRPAASLRANACDDHLYPKNIRSLARVGFSLVIASLLLAVVLFFIDATPDMLLAVPAFIMAGGLVILQLVLSKIGQIPNKKVGVSC